MLNLAGWENFYVIVGSSAGALIGLQFVVMTLLAERPPMGVREAGAAFSTPTVLHFATALALSAILCVPWPTLAAPAVLCGVIGLAGAAYTSLVAWRMHAQNVYAPDIEDWLCHAVVPLAAYLAIANGGAALFFHVDNAMLAIGAAILALLLDGIHNAWDAVAWHVAARARNQRGT